MWYKAPIRPFDPVIDLDQATGAIRYFRDSFGGSGQFSQILPPATPQDQFQLMSNVMPPIRGVIEKRWGYAPFINSLGFVPQHLDVYANEASNPPSRKIIALGANTVSAYTEAGLPYNSSIYSPTAPPLMAYSRSTAYFFDGASASKKWNGAASGGTSLTGIDINNATGTTSNTNVTTAFTSSALYADGGGPNPWGISTSAGFAKTAPQGTTLNTNELQSTVYGFALPSGACVSVVQVSATYSMSDSSGGLLDDFLCFQMLKNGVPYGPPVFVDIVLGSGQVATATWNITGGLSLSDTDVNASNFGVQVYAFLDWQNPNSDDHSWLKNISFAGGNIKIALTYNATVTSNSITISSTSSSGSITLTNGRIYYCVFRNSTTGHMSDLSVPSASTGPLTAKEVSLSGIPQSLDPQVDVKWLLATADGGDETLLYFLAELPNATGSYVDNTDELTLLAHNIVQETDANGNDIGVADNVPPPLGVYPIKHQGRLFLAHNSTLYCSKNLQELTTSTGLICGRYEEAWPPTYQFDISDDAELIQALLSDGTTLYVCTNRHIRRVTGDSPLDFQLTQIALNEVGVSNHEAISIVYSAGTPAGAAWLTPDLRVGQSDFNTYTDIGVPIQDVLNTCNNPLYARATFFSDGAYDLFVLTFPTGSNLTSAADTWCVYDTRNQTWVTWKLAVTTTPLLFLINQSGTPIWLFSDNAGTVYQLASVYSTDNGAGIVSTITTAMVHLGSPTSRKYLNEIELLTADANLLVSVSGADTGSQLSGSSVIVSNAPLTVSPLGPYKVFLAGNATHYRYFQFSFTSSSALSGPMLETFNIEAVPIHQL